MSFIEFSVHSSNEAEEAVANILNEAGANGVLIENINDISKPRKSNFGEILDVDVHKYPQSGARIKAYFLNDDTWQKSKLDLIEKIKALQNVGFQTKKFYFTENTVEAKDWENEWKKYYKIEHVTDRFCIVPEWENYNKKNDELVIWMDPGMAFGTGTHPTTKLSLQALEDYVNYEDQVIDVGTGSGILSIAACLLGARNVYAYDLDPVAIQSAKMNSDRNHCADKIDVLQHDLLKDIRKKADVIVSNILADILIDLVDDAWCNLKNDGYFITAGIIEEKQSLVENKLLNKGFCIIERKQKENWICMIAQKRNM